jgi:hypothetical protein
MLRNVLEPACGEVVQNVDGMPLLQKQVHEVRTDEARTPGHKDAFSRHRDLQDYTCLISNSSTSANGSAILTQYDTDGLVRLVPCADHHTGGEEPLSGGDAAHAITAHV